jgi:outer membrane protein assembly factor BamE
MADHIASANPMPIPYRIRGRLTPTLLLVFAAASLTGCALEPYRMPIVQGNVVTQEQVAALKPGMSRFQVRDLLGTPLLGSVFHGDRWDYVFTFKQQGREPQARKVTVFFKGEALDRFEADQVPTVAEFASTLGRQDNPKVPPLEATPEQLQDFPPPAQAAAQPPLPPLPSVYPPLETASP